jgi:hypothetical protein
VWGVSTSAAGLDARMLQVMKLVLTKLVSLVVRPDALVRKLVSPLVRRSSIECTGAPRLLVPHVLDGIYHSATRPLVGPRAH